MGINIEELSKDLKVVRKELSESGKKTEHLMPCIFGKTTDEDFLSDWLAFILNPRVNSLGVGPLNKLLELAGYGEILDGSDEIKFENPGEYHVTREVMLSENDRIDFLIRVNCRDDETINGTGKVIAIENKVFSWLSKPDQLTSYSDNLKQDYAHDEIYKVFLAPKKTIEGISESDLGGFMPVSHEDYVEEIKMIPLDPINNLRAAFLIREYINNMEMNVFSRGDNMDLSNELIQFICKNNTQINEIVNKRNQFFKELRRKVYEIVNEKCFKSGYEPSGIDGNRAWCYWYREEWAYSNNIHFEVVFDDKVFDEKGAIIVWLCVHYEGKNPKINDVRKLISKNMVGENYTPSNSFERKEYNSKFDIVAVALRNYKDFSDKNSIEKLGNILADEMARIRDLYEGVIESLV